MPELQKPLPDEIEVSILGGGNGYGESVAIHAGFGHWIIVDSAIDPSTEKSLALSYFEEIGVDPSANVGLIIASHWHDDHIKGLADLVGMCHNALFACSHALSPKEFLILLGMDEKISSYNSGLKEFRAIFQRLKSSGRKIIRGLQDRVLWQTSLPDGTDFRVAALSPSDEAVLFFEAQLKQLLDESSPSKVIRDISPNHTSIVATIKIGDEEICLGGDLEDKPGKNMGWQAVLQAQLVPHQAVSVFKVPHHGSQNAYCPDFWVKAFRPDPVAGLTPYSRGRKKLPSSEDISNIYKHTRHAYTTAPPERGREKRRDLSAKKIIRDFGYEVREIPFSYGHICLRKKIGQADQPWRVALRGKARELRELISG